MDNRTVGAPNQKKTGGLRQIPFPYLKIPTRCFLLRPPMLEAIKNTGSGPNVGHFPGTQPVMEQGLSRSSACHAAARVTEQRYSTELLFNSLYIIYTIIYHIYHCIRYILYIRYVLIYTVYTIFAIHHGVFSFSRKKYSKSVTPHPPHPYTKRGEEEEEEEEEEERVPKNALSWKTRLSEDKNQLTAPCFTIFHDLKCIGMHSLAFARIWSTKHTISTWKTDQCEFRGL